MLEILGVELGVTAVRGVIYDAERQEIVLAAECPLNGPAIDSSGALNEQVMVPALDDVLYTLGITAPATIRAGLTIGPSHGGVGSGPALHDWLVGKSNAIGQPISYSGNIGISFAPLNAIEEAQAIAAKSGLVLDRIELAPVAAARVLGDEVEDVVTIGSGRGWRARIRRHEVLEAVVSDDVTADEPLLVITSAGQALEVESYSSVTIADSLLATSRLDLGQLAVCVGAALGVAHDSGGNLLVGQLLGDPNSAGAKRSKDRQPVADFFTRSPRQQNAGLFSEQAAEPPLDGLLMGGSANQGIDSNATTQIDALVELPDVKSNDQDLLARPKGESAKQSGQTFAARFAERASSSGSAKDPYATSYEDDAAPNDFSLTDYPAEQYPAGNDHGLESMPPAPSHADFLQTHHQPAGSSPNDLFAPPVTGDGYPAPVNRDGFPPPVNRDGFPPPVNRAPAPLNGDGYPAPVGRDAAPTPSTTALAPPPAHRNDFDSHHVGPADGGFDSGLAPAPSRVSRDRSRGTNQPELVSDDALINQFSPEPDAENWAEQSQTGINIMIALLTISALVLLGLYLFV